MNTLSLWKIKSVRAALGMAVIVGLLVAPALAASEQTGRPGGATTAKTAPSKTETAKAEAAKRERQADIRKGIELLQRAKEYLQYKDTKDFGGHKEKTMDYIEHAIKELRDALEADK